MEVLVVNPTQKDEAQAIKMLLTSYPDNNIFKQGEEYSVSISEVETLVILTHDLILVDNLVAEIEIDDDVQFDTSRDEKRKYFVIDNKIYDKGAYGSVSDVLGRWTINNGRVAYKNTTTRVIKACSRNDSLLTTVSQKNPNENASRQSTVCRKEIAREFELLSRIPYFNVKHSLIMVNNSFLLIMSKVGFINLDDWMQMNVLSQKRIDTNQLLHLVIRTIDMLTDFHDTFEIIHGDIKPPNIRLECRRGFLMPKLVDLGVSFFSSKPEVGVWGDLGYIDPFNLAHDTLPVDTQSDQYALLITLMELLGAELNEADPLAQKQHVNWSVDTSTLFFACQDLAKTDKDKLESALINGISINRQNRISFSDVRRAFVEVLANRLKQVRPKYTALLIPYIALDFRLDRASHLAAWELDEVFRNFHALMVLDELISTGIITHVLDFSLQEYINTELENAMQCSDILLSLNDTLSDIVSRFKPEDDVPNEIIKFHAHTLSLAHMPIELKTSHFNMIAHRLLLQSQVTQELKQKPDNEQQLLRRLSMFATESVEDETIMSSERLLQ